MQGTAMAQRQLPRAIPVQIQANAILNMGILELQQFIDAESMENPALAVDESARCPVCGFLAGPSACPVCGASEILPKSTEIDYRLDERDYLEHAFAVVAREDVLDPFSTVATPVELRDHLRQQARMCLAGRALRIAEFLIDSLDDDGYLRESLYETAEQFAAAVPEIEGVLTVIQSFDPPGVAARDLRESLLLQLRHMCNSAPIARYAERIIAEHWDDFSRMKLKAISKATELPESVLREACEFVSDNLNPRPASAYCRPFEGLSPRDTAALVPDVMIENKNGSLKVSVVDWHSTPVQIDEVYDRVYRSHKSGDCCLAEDESRHVKEHVERVKTIIEAIGLRKKTLARVAMSLVEHQKAFILHGPSHLKPLKQKEIAKELGVHESTICRALANKHCRLPSGEVVSFEVFFDCAMPIREMISRLIATSTEPLSDSEIAKRLAEQGVTIARRTVAKYRDQLRLLPYQLRMA